MLTRFALGDIVATEWTFNRGPWATAAPPQRAAWQSATNQEDAQNGASKEDGRNDNQGAVTMGGARGCAAGLLAAVVTCHRTL